MFILNKKPSEIDKLQKKLDLLRPFTSGELERLKEEFVVEYTYDSNAIEGSTLTLDETALLLKENIIIAEKPMSDHSAASGHKDAYYYVEGLVKCKEPLNENQILDIYNLVLMDRPEDKGKYRNLPVQILGTNAKLTEPFMIKKHMEELL